MKGIIQMEYIGLCVSPKYCYIKREMSELKEKGISNVLMVKEMVSGKC